VAGVLAVAALGACVVIPKLPKKEAYVYSFDMIGYVDFYSMGAESYGMVTTDRVQTEMLSGSQIVSQILVYEGQHVRKGEVLYRYDTTLSDLEIERKELAIQQMERSLKIAENERKEMNSLKAMVVKEAEEETTDPTEPTEDPTESVTDPTEEPETAAPSDPSPQEDSEEKNDNKDGGNALIFVAIGLCVLIIGMVVAIVVILKKKKA
jgi:hypothetical protein